MLILVFLHIYTEKDIASVMRATHTINDWSTLGIELGLTNDIIVRIKTDYSKHLDCLRNMLSHWIDTGRASWVILVTALRSPLVCKEGLASEITRDYPCKCTCV